MYFQEGGGGIFDALGEKWIMTRKVFFHPFWYSLPKFSKFSEENPKNKHA